MAISENTASPHADAPVAWLDEISLADIFRWGARWWWLVVGGAFVGLLGGLICHLAIDQRFAVRIDMSIGETPLGTATFVRDVSSGVLRQQLDAATAIQWDSKKGALSLIERDVPEDEILARQLMMRDAVATLGDFLEKRLSRQYSEMQADFAAMPPSPEGYAALTRFRQYLTALEEGLLQSVTIVSESTRPQNLSFAILLVLGALAGAAVAGAAAFIIDLLRSRRMSLGV